MSPSPVKIWRAALLGLALCTVLAPLAGATDADVLARARAAAAAGDTARAVALYDGLLAGAPDDVTLLNESAQQLSWAGRYDEALARYQRVLSARPDDRFALVERAKVLSWSGRYRESTDAFRALLAANPSDTEARLGLARSLSWSGDQAAARAEFERILAARPDDYEALLGLARTYAWSGRLDEARRLYQQAASATTDDKDARVGIAYLDLWEGDLGSAWVASGRLAAAYPGDRDVADLDQALRRALAPWFAAGWDQMEDTERNLLTASRLEVNGRLPNGMGIGISYVDYDVRSAGERGTIDSLQARVDWSPRRRHRLEAMFGTDRLGRPGQSGHFVSDWGLRYAFPVALSWNGSIGARREPYRYSVPLIDNRIVVDSVTASVSGTLREDWLVNAGIDSWDVSDGNRRVAGDMQVRRRWRLGGSTVEAGGALRWLDWQYDLDSGYFDPSAFLSVGAIGHAFGSLPGYASVSYDLSLEAGLQSFDFGGAETRGDPYYLATGRLTWQAARTLNVELFAEAGSYASEGSEDWRYTRAGLRLVWQPGNASR